MGEFLQGSQRVRPGALCCFSFVSFFQDREVPVGWRRQGGTAGCDGWFAPATRQALPELEFYTDQVLGLWRLGCNEIDMM